MGSIHRAPGDYPDGKAGAVLTVDFVVAGIPCMGLNGGPHYQHSEAFSFQFSPQPRRKRIATGMPLSPMAAKPVTVVGVKTNGELAGRILPEF